jgi:hypothetical protein
MKDEKILRNKVQRGMQEAGQKKTQHRGFMN